ncbi:MAG: glycosyltransferase family 2 protein [Rhodomicrobium sp.]|nr:glycosyltransferase family 2 protein [Rhodomicrobium sp.]
MWDIFTDGFAYLTSQSWNSLIALFWFVILFELPRYLMVFMSAGVSLPFQQSYPRPIRPLRVTAVIAGHNEAYVIERCILALHEQTRVPDEIIVVSDGSTDAMAARLRDLTRRGLVTQVHSTGLRAGKSAATNLGIKQATGDIIINIDCDCTLDRYAFEKACEPFGDPSVGAVAGNIVVRNPDKSFITGYQSVEYLVILSLGKRGGNITDQVTCASGAFGAFRREALRDVNGLDAGGGEDLDITMRIRKAGWKVRFAPEAVCYTDVPETFSAFIRQRFRWERDAIRLRYRKHNDQLNPLSWRLRPSELMHQIEFLAFDVAAALAMPVYLVWLFSTYGDLAPAILLAAQLGLFAIDLVTISLATLATPKVLSLRYLFFMPGYSVLNSYFMRFIRLAAYFQEWLFDASYADSYVPTKVHLQRY